MMRYKFKFAIFSATHFITLSLQRPIQVHLHRYYNENITTLSSLLLSRGSSSFHCSLSHLALASFTLNHSLDYTYSNRLTHNTYGKSTKRGIVGECFDSHWLLWTHVDNSGITRLDHGWILFKYFSTTTVNFLNQFRKLAGNVRRVTVDNWCVTSVDLTRVVQDNNLKQLQFVSKRH